MHQLHMLGDFFWSVMNLVDCVRGLGGSSGDRGFFFWLVMNLVDCVRGLGAGEGLGLEG